MRRRKIGWRVVDWPEEPGGQTMAATDAQVRIHPARELEMSYAGAGAGGSQRESEQSQDSGEARAAEKTAVRSGPATTIPSAPRPSVKPPHPMCEASVADRELHRKDEQPSVVVMSANCGRCRHRSQPPTPASARAPGPATGKAAGRAAPHISGARLSTHEPPDEAHDWFRKPFIPRFRLLPARPTRC